MTCVVIPFPRAQSRLGPLKVYQGRPCRVLYVGSEMVWIEHIGENGSVQRRHVRPTELSGLGDGEAS